jgi:hypothetical protein
MPKLTKPLPTEPIFHHAENLFANKLNQVMEAVREIQDYINSEDDEPKLTAAQKKAAAAAEKEAEAVRQAELEAKAKADADASK